MKRAEGEKEKETEAMREELDEKKARVDDLQNQVQDHVATVKDLRARLTLAESQV